MKKMRRSFRMYFTSDWFTKMNNLSKEEILILKIAEYSLALSVLDNSIRSLLKSVRKAGTSHYQKLVLESHLKEVEEKADNCLKIKWPI